MNTIVKNQPEQNRLKTEQDRLKRNSGLGPKMGMCNYCGYAKIACKCPAATPATNDGGDSNFAKSNGDDDRKAVYKSPELRPDDLLLTSEDSLDELYAKEGKLPENTYRAVSKEALDEVEKRFTSYRNRLALLPGVTAEELKNYTAVRMSPSLLVISIPDPSRRAAFLGLISDLIYSKPLQSSPNKERRATPFSDPLLNLLDPRPRADRR